MSFYHAAAPNLSDEVDTLLELFLNSSRMKYPVAYFGVFFHGGVVG